MTGGRLVPGATRAKGGVVGGANKDQGAMSIRRLKSYPDYKSSSVEWLGEIPAHWNITPLFTAAVERQVPNRRAQEANVLSLSYGRIIRRNTAGNFGLLPESFETYQIVAPGNIVLRLTDLQNDKRSLRVGLVAERGIITSAYVSLNVIGRLTPPYAFYLLHAYDLTKVFYTLGGGVRQTMRFEDLKWVPMLVPEASEQRAIATFLDRETARIDALVAKKEWLIELLREQRAAIITQAVTKGVSPRVPMNDSGIEWLGLIPAHWTARRMAYLTRMTSGGTPSKANPEYWRGEIPWVSPKDMKAQVIADAIDHVSEAAVFETGLALIRPPAVLIVVRGMILAHTFPVAYTTANVTINQDMKALRLIKEIDPKYFVYLLEGLSGFVLSLIEDAGHGTKRLRTDLWRAMKVYLPPLDEQRNISAFLEREVGRYDGLAERVAAAIDRLKELRTALISAAVTGKIDVREEIA